MRRSAYAVLTLLIVFLPAGTRGEELERGEEVSPSRAPNVVLVITDDQGYGDLGCHGNPVLRTPALDRLHAESVRLTNFHVDPTCAPTRAALMTGRYSGRVGVWHTVMGREILRDREVTLAELLGGAGYATGIFGKWHLGDHYPYRPQDQGFQESVVHGGGGVGQVPDHWGNDYFDDVYLRNGKPTQAEGYCTDFWFREASRFIEENRDRPFFAYIATNAPHDPYLVPESYQEVYEGKPEVANAAFLGMIACIDENLGRLMDHLDRLGLSRETIVIFMTDNGSAAGYNPRTKRGFNSGMRGLKGSQYEGGHRVPCFIRWPGGGIGGKGAGRDVTRLSAHFDLFPTLAELCQAKVPEGLRLDGKSLVPLLRGSSETWPERTLVVESQRVDHPQKWRQCAVMNERYRLINGKELYDLRGDPGQLKDIAAEQPRIVQQLRAYYEGWWAEVSPSHEGYARVPIGSEVGGDVVLTCHDWHGEPLIAYQRGVREGVVGNGFWAVEVARPGTYDIRLRRWPEEEDRAINDGPGPWATRARLKVGTLERVRTVDDQAVESRFRMELPSGPTEIQSWFEGEGVASRGAYYLYVRRVED